MDIADRDHHTKDLLRDHIENADRVKDKIKFTKFHFELGSAEFSRTPENHSQVDSFIDNHAKTAVATLLHQWIKAISSQVLVIGRSQIPRTRIPNVVKSATSLAIRQVDYARGCGLPVIYHICRRQKPETGLVNFAQSLLRRLIEFMPPVLDPEIGSQVNLEEVKLLQQTFDVWETVLHAIDTMLHFMPPILVLVIDNLHEIYHPSTDGYFRSLFRVLLKHERQFPYYGCLGEFRWNTTLKILITSIGEPHWLMEVISEDGVFHRRSRCTSDVQKAKWHDELLSHDVWAVKTRAEVFLESVS